MGSKIEYVESSHVYVTNYVRNSKAVGVLWGIFTICYAIIIIVSFVTPEWIGDTSASENSGRFGLWTRCFFRGSSELSGIGVEECVGQLHNFNSIGPVAFKAATILVGISVIIALFTLCAMLLFFFFASTKVFLICGWMQLMSALFLILGVLTYPAGWDSSEIRQICGPDANSYELGDCGIRWSYLLAGIGCFDAIILATLAFILASKHVKLQPEQGHLQGGQIFKEEMTAPYLCDAQSLAGSRKSLNIHPVLMMPQPVDPDRYSEFSNRTGRTKSSAYRAGYPSNPSIRQGREVTEAVKYFQQSGPPLSTSDYQGLLANTLEPTPLADDCGSLSSRALRQYLTNQVAWGQPLYMPKPLKYESLDLEKKRRDLKPFAVPTPIQPRNAGHWSEILHFGRLYSGSKSFDYHSHLMNLSEDRNVHETENTELCPAAQFSSPEHRTLQLLHHCSSLSDT